MADHLLPDFLHADQWVGHLASLGVIAVSMTGLIPAAAALVAFFWYVVQLYESRTFQLWLLKRRIRQTTVQAAKIEAVNLVKKAKMAADALVAKEAALAMDKLRNNQSL